MTERTPTPRCDSLSESGWNDKRLWDFARQLERELSEARQSLALYKLANKELTDRLEALKLIRKDAETLARSFKHVVLPRQQGRRILDQVAKTRCPSIGEAHQSMPRRNRKKRAG